MNTQELIEEAEAAIRDASHRSSLLDELFDEMGISQNVGEAIFENSPSAEVSKQAEQELLGLIKTQQQNSVQQMQGGTRKRRPTMMRGMMI